MRRLMTVEDRLPASLARLGHGLLLLPKLQLLPRPRNQPAIEPGDISVELRAEGHSAVVRRARVVETTLPFHQHCLVLVVDGEEEEVPIGTEVWVDG